MVTSVLVTVALETPERIILVALVETFNVLKRVLLNIIPYSVKYAVLELPTPEV